MICRCDRFSRHRLLCSGQLPCRESLQLLDDSPKLQKHLQKPSQKQSFMCLECQSKAGCGRKRSTKELFFCDLRNVSVCAPTQAVGKTSQRQASVWL